MDVQSIKNRFGIIGNAPLINHALTTAIQVAPTDLTVLINGESGVGKEAFSHIIHSLSPRKHDGFIALNCGAIPDGTIDSELFGHEKGAFTGAMEARKGYFETVNGGTIFLDEIGEMPLGTQARLLRVLETGEYIKVGSSKVQKTDVRVIAATNRDLNEFIEKNKFREDLYYRISTVPIKVPPLRERREDIVLLFRKFAADFADKYRTAPIQLTEEAKSLLMGLSFPGNIRELKNLAEQISVLSATKTITPELIESFLPEGNKRANKLPVLASDGKNNHTDWIDDREMVYKMMFEVKKEVNELKKHLGKILENPTLLNADFEKEQEQDEEDNVLEATPVVTTYTHLHPTTVELKEAEPKDNIIPEMESLNIMDKERELIIKALKKHRSRRRDASNDLGISERTLYRKLKEYDIEDL